MEATDTQAAHLLADHAAAYRAAVRPVDSKAAKVALEASARMAHAFGWAMTPFGVELAALDAVDAAGPFPPATADNARRKEWAAATAAAILDTLKVGVPA